jgi:hypothetical protein
MSDFVNIEFFEGEGLFFEAFIADEDRRFFLDLSTLAYIAGKKLIDDRVVALVVFNSVRNRIHRMCSLAHTGNPNWPVDRPLKLTREHIR